MFVCWNIAAVSLPDAQAGGGLPYKKGGDARRMS